MNIDKTGRGIVLMLESIEETVADNKETQFIADSVRKAIIEIQTKLSRKT